MNFKKIIKAYKIPATLSFLALVGVSFLIGAVVLATSDNDNILRRALAASGIVNNAPGNDLPTGWHDFNVDDRCDIVGWSIDPDSPDTDVTYKVYSDNSLVGTYKASSVRPDLADLEVCSGGSCGINATLPITGSHNIKITVIDNETGQEVNLPNTNQAINCANDAALPPDQQTRQDINITSALSTSPSEARITVRNNSATLSYNLRLESFAAGIDFDGDLDDFVASQTLYRTDSATLSPGQSRTFRVDIPPCVAWQVDFRSIGTGAVILASDIGGSMNSCPPQNPALGGSCQGVPSRVSIDQNVTWSAQGTGGTGSYTYSWSGDASGNGQSVTRSYSTAGTKTATVTISSGGESVTRNCSIIVDAPQTQTLAGSCQGLPSTVNIGQTVNWSASATGGTGSYNFNWSGAVSGSGATRTATYNQVGTQTATVVISSGAQSITRSCSVNVVDNTLSLTGSCQGIPSTVNIGQTVNWSASATGGTGSYAYSWSGAASGSTQNVSASYNSAGTQTATVVITSGAQSVTARCNVNVVPATASLDGSCTANPSTAIIGQNITWAASATGGTGSYTYSWSGDVSGNGSTVTTNFSSAGTRTGTVVITSGGNSISRTCQATVTAPTQTLGVSCSASGSTYRVGDTITWTSNPTGGTGSYSYSWTGTDGLSSNSQNTARSYSTTGTKTGTITVTSGGQSAQATCQVTISDSVITNPALNVSCSANPSNVAIGQNVTWNSNVTGGTGFYNYYWSGTDNLSGNSQSVTRSYSNAGTKTGTITVTSGGQTSQATCSALVGAANVILTTNPVPNPLSYVYLSQIPYTGLVDDMGKVGKMFMLIAWSALVAFVGLKIWNKREQFAFASGIDAEANNSVVGKLKSVFASIMPGAFESPYVAVQSEVLQGEEVAETTEDELDESEEIEAEEVVRDIEALSNLAMDRKALISRQALGAIYEDHDGDFEEASLDLIKVIGRAALAYPREDGWIVLNSERLSALR